METKTINNIREKRDSIRKKIKELDISTSNQQVFGSESEYTIHKLIGGVESLLTDISTLTKYPSKFIRISTYSERHKIYTSLVKIDLYLNQPNNFINEFELLKVTLRNYNIQQFSERQIEFQEEIEEVRKIKLQLQQQLVESKELSQNIDKSNKRNQVMLEDSKYTFNQIEDKFVDVREHNKALIDKAEELENLNSQLLEVEEIAKQHIEEITQALSESKSNEKLINSFAKKVHDREKKLDELEQRTDENNSKIELYEKERKSLLEKANELIETSKKALNYKTAEGISASFQEQYDSSNKKIIFGSWIVGSLICLIGAVFLGIWILEANTGNVGLLIGRISLLPLPIIGAIFCAKQYTKQKNIIEDYAYKMVVSKAIVGFSEQLKKNGTENNEEYVHYIKTALEEIHKDPLRKREKKSNSDKGTNLKNLVEMAEKIAKLSKVDV